MNNLDVNSSDLGDYIKGIIQEKHWSIRKAAMKIDISASYISKIINHKAIANPKSETLDKIADGLNVSRSEIYEASNRLIAPEINIDNEYKPNTNDLAQAIDNDEYTTYHGKKLSQDDKDVIKAILKKYDRK